MGNINCKGDAHGECRGCKYAKQCVNIMKGYPQTVIRMSNGLSCAIVKRRNGCMVVLL